MAATSKEMEIAIKIAGKVDASLKNALGVVGKGIGGMTKTISAATTAAAAAVGAIATASVNVGKEFESSMSQVSATMLIDKTTQEGAAAYATLEEAARECGRTTAFSATEAAEGLNYLALAGYDANQAAAALPTVLKLAGAGAMDLASASDMVTDSMSALNIEATQDNLNNFADQMAMTASKANTSVSQLGEAILTVGATASNLAGGTKELDTALGLLANNGIKGAEGGTHLRNVILSLQNPTDAASAALAKYTSGVYDAQGNMRSLQDIFGDLSKSMEGMTQAQKDNIISSIFNKTDLTSANALLANCGEQWDKLADSVGNAAGACEDMYNIQLDNLDGDIAKLKSGLSDLGISIYEDLNGPLRSVTQLGTDMISELSDAYSQGGLTGMVGAVGGCLSEIVAQVGEYAPRLLDMGIGLVESFIQGIVDNSGSIGETGAQLITKFVTGISGMLPEIANAAVEIITSFANSMLEGDNLTAITQGAVNAISGFINAIVNHLPEIMEAGRQIITQLISGILSGSDGSFGDIATRIGILLFALQPLIGLFGGLSGIMGKFSGAIGSISGLFGKLGSAAQTATAPVKAASGGLQALSANAKGILALGAGFLLVASGMALLSASAVGIANAGPGAAAALVLLCAAVAGMAVGAAALAPALMAGAAGLVAFGGGVALVGVGILAATGGLAILATQLPNIAAYGGSAATAILSISASLIALSAGSVAAAAGIAALLLPMVGGVATTAAFGVSVAALAVSSGVALAAFALLLTTMMALNATILAAIGEVSLLSSNIAVISSYGPVASAALVSISAALVTLSAGSVAAAAGIAALFIPMAGGVVTTAALCASIAALAVSSGVALAAFALLLTTMDALNATMTSIKNNATEAGQAIGNMQTGVDVISTGLNTIQSVASDAIKAFVSIFQKETPSLSSAAKSMMNGLNSALDSGFNTAKSKAQQAAGSIRSAFNNMSITIPKPKIPVINVAYDKIQFGNGGNTKIPKFDVSWHALGGIFTKPTILNSDAGMHGFGESGNEAILPLDTLWSKMREVVGEIVQKNSGPSVFENLTARIGKIGSGEVNKNGAPALVGAGGGQYTYSPIYNLYGSAGKEEIQEADKMSRSEFAKMMKQWEHDNKRKKL